MRETAERSGTTDGTECAAVFIAVFVSILIISQLGTIGTCCDLRFVLTGGFSAPKWPHFFFSHHP